MYDRLICRAIAICGGSQKELARRMGEKPEKVSYLLNRAKKIRLEDALKIEAATDGVVTRYHLAGRINMKVKHLLAEKPKAINELKLSERVSIGMAYGAESGKRQGARTDLKPGKVKARSDTLEADYVGFKNRDTYRQAKKVITCGVLELVQAMDDKRIAISTAAKLISLPEDEQRRILQLSKKEIIAQAKQVKRIIDNDTTQPSKDGLDAFLLNFLRIYLLLIPYTTRNEAE